MARPLNGLHACWELSPPRRRSSCLGASPCAKVATQVSRHLEAIADVIAVGESAFRRFWRFSAFSAFPATNTLKRQSGSQGKLGTTRPHCSLPSRLSWLLRRSVSLRGNAIVMVKPTKHWHRDDLAAFTVDLAWTWNRDLLNNPLVRATRTEIV